MHLANDSPVADMVLSIVSGLGPHQGFTDITEILQGGHARFQRSDEALLDRPALGAPLIPAGNDKSLEQRSALPQQERPVDMRG